MAEESALIEELRERTQRASQSWRPGATVTSVEPLTGGSSSLTFTIRFEGVPESDEVVVLKVAPPGLPPVRNRDVLHQGTLMRALAGRDGVTVPEVLFEDAGDPPEISPFLAMNLVPGECLEPILQASPDPARFGEFRSRAFDAARMLAAMHRLEPATIGLGQQPVVSIKPRSTVGYAPTRRRHPTSSSTTRRSPTPSARPSPRRYARSSTMVTTASATPSASTATSTPSSTGRSGPSATRGST
jgi:hypothetical protein